MPIPASTIGLIERDVHTKDWQTLRRSRLVAAPATLRASLLSSPPLCPAFHLPTYLPFRWLLSLSHPHLVPLYLPTLGCVPPPTTISPSLPYVYSLSFYIYQSCIRIYNYHHYHYCPRHHYRQPSLLLSNSIRGASALASSDSVLTRRAGILRFHQLSLLSANSLTAA